MENELTLYWANNLEYAQWRVNCVPKAAGNTSIIMLDVPNSLLEDPARLLHYGDEPTAEWQLVSL